LLDSFQGDVTEASSNKDTSCEMWDDLAGKLKHPASFTFKEYVSIHKKEKTMEIMDDAAIMESVS
jgi:hypothetical protein